MFIKKAIYPVLINLFFFSTAGILFGQDARISGNLEIELARMSNDEFVPVIIHLSDQVDLKSFKKKTDKALRRSNLIKALTAKKTKSQKNLLSFLKQNKARHVKSFWIFNGVSAEVPAPLISKLAALAEVSRIDLDAEIRAPEITTAASSLPEWNIEMIGAPQLWNLGIDGSGVVVGIMDSGVDYFHPDLISKWRGGTNSWFDPYNQHQNPHDATGHGTGVTGIILGGDAGGSSIGVAPGSQWIAAKIFADNGSSTVSMIHEAFQWFLDPDGDPDTDDAADIINGSWYLLNTVNECDTEFRQDIATLRAAEIAVILSAGNSGPSIASSVSPANNSGSISVGAIDSLQYVAGFSGRGPSACDANDVYPTLVAPGVSVRTADLSFGGLPNSYIAATGTSFAVPHVAGAMALLLSAFPDLTVSELESALNLSALDLGEVGPDNTSGYGLVDPLEAYFSLRRFSIAPVLMLLLSD